MTKEQLNKDLDRSMEDLKNNRVISAKELKKQIKKWR